MSGITSHIDRLDRKTQAAHAAITSPYTRVVLDANGRAVIATASDLAYGVTIDTVAAAGGQGFVVADGPGLTEKRVAGAVTAGDDVYAAAAGAVSATPGPYLEGRALDPATAAGDHVRVDPTFRGPVAVTHVVTAGEASANLAEVDTGFGDDLAFALVQIIEPTNGTVRAVTNVLALSGGDAGKVRIGSTAMAASDTIHIFPVLKARAVV